MFKISRGSRGYTSTCILALNRTIRALFPNQVLNNPVFRGFLDL